MDHVTGDLSSDWAKRAFCSRCGSNGWFHVIAQNTMSVVAGLFQPTRDFAVARQIFVDERRPWARLTATTVEKTGAQVIAGFQSGDQAS